VAYIIDPTLFRAVGAIVAWNTAARRLGLGAALGANRDLPNTVQLRWALSGSVGLPTEPFKVWSRRRTNGPEWEVLNIQSQSGFLGVTNLIGWAGGSVSSVRATIQATSGGSIAAFTAAPTLNNICAFTSIAAGATSVQMSAHRIDGLMVSPGITVSALQGTRPGILANGTGWTLLELVGLPVDPAAWAGIGKHTDPQGLVGSLSDAQTAATARLKRGAPPIGWGAALAAGVAAPAWAAPNFGGLISEMNTELLGPLAGIVKAFPPNAQAGQLVTVPLPPPANSSGQHMSGGGSQASVSPLVMSFIAGATDPFLSLGLGFGTAYAQGSGPAGIEGEVDFMVTAHWQNGLDGKSAALDYAAIIPYPVLAPAPPPPANLFGQVAGALRPLQTDGDWRETLRVAWDRPIDSELVGAVSFAAARAGIAPASPTVALMAPRAAGGWRTITINAPSHPPDPESYRLSVMDREIDIPSNPGSAQLKYAVAMQDIYGQWTPWSVLDQNLQEPGLAPVRIVSATLAPAIPASGSICPTTLEIEFLWEWRVRTPARVTFVGHLYAAATHGAPPPSFSVPAGLDRSLSGGGAALVVTFAGDTPSAPGAVIVALTEAGDTFLPAFGAAQGNVTRRYRMTLSGLSLDFASTPFIGLALWAQGQERIAPQRVSPWSNTPAVISASDPRPPVVPIVHVKLASLPDAAGCSHARIGWTASGSAVGYFVYEASEANLLDAFGLPPAAPSNTLDARLAVLNSHFGANPLRRPFTRLNATALTGTSTDVVLPRGSTGIHCYIVIGISAGGVEADWPKAPGADNAMIALAAPRVSRPAPPTIEAVRVLNATNTPPTYQARLLITTRPGLRPRRIDIHRVRVDDAARVLDTMGPPIARVRATAAPWTVTTAPDAVYGPYIAAVQGVDEPSGSWRRVWYRAAAWTDEDDTRGLLAGRSEASNAAWVVLPPPLAPVLSALMLGGGATPDVTLQWTCGAPVAVTPIGPHAIAVRAAVVGGATLITLDSTLDKLGNAAPATGSGVWITGTASGVTTYRALIRRAAISDVVRFLVQITDPIGRTGEQVLTIGAGSVHPAPNLTTPAVQRLLTPPPGRSSVRFTSTSPTETLIDGAYVVKVTAVPRVPRLIPPPPSVQMALGAVPTRVPALPLPPLFITRSGSSYETSAAGDVGSFVVRITSPDGQFTEKTAS
jgi:hypothetical protein